MNKFILMVGVPGSGKSTYAERIAEKEKGTVISSDTLREELFGSVWEFRRNVQLFGEMFKRCHKLLGEGRTVIFDATNIRRSERKRVAGKFRGYTRECYYIKAPLQRILEQNKSRDRNVPEEVILRMFRRIQEPQADEGWDRIHVIDSSQSHPEAQPGSPGEPGPR